jgi:hypothetical protein
MSNQVIEYSSSINIENVILSRVGPKTFSPTIPPLNNFIIDNPYFQNVREIINKFGDSPSPYYTINFSYTISGTIGFTRNCISNMYLDLNDSTIMDLFRILGADANAFWVERPYSLGFDSKNITPPYSRIFNFNLRIKEYDRGWNADPICNYNEYILIKLEFTYYGKVFIDKFCTENFNDPICLNYCNQPENTESCVKQSISWCFDKPLDPQYSRFFNFSTCETFVKQYMATNVSHPQYDKIFRNICKTLNVDASNYKNYTRGVDPQFDLKIKNICSCNLDDSIYNNFLDSFAAEIPTIKAANFGSKKCIFPECSTSEYKPTEILGYNTCPSIDCINVTQIDNNGRIIGGLTITQSSDCPNLQDPRRPCGQDSECGLGKKCFGGLCVDNNVCRVKSNCDVDSKCYNNICVRDDFCTRDSDCGDGLKCSKNICVKEVNVSDVRKTLIIFIAVGGIFLLLLSIILFIFFIKKVKRNK